MNKVCIVETEQHLKLWMQVLKNIVNNQPHDKPGIGWWFKQWDFEHCENVLRHVIFNKDSEQKGIALYTSNAIVAGAMWPHFLSPDLVWCEEFICRSASDGKKVRKAFIKLAKEKGAHAIICDNVPDCIIPPWAVKSHEITKSLGYKLFSTRYVYYV